MFVSVEKFADAVCTILPGCTVYLTGSAAVGDYRDGWSDIDLLIFADSDGIADEQAKILVNLRQSMTESEPGNPYYRKIEGAAVPARGFWNGADFTAVYWGTTGQRILTGYRPDVFTLAAMRQWKLLRGQDLREFFLTPSRKMLKDAVRHHWETIRDHGTSTVNPMYRCGWMLDIARCLYTLKTNRVISKTAAGETALRNGWCPCEDALRDALRVRKNPKTETCVIPDEAIVRFNEVLEKELAKPINILPCYCGHDCGRCFACLGETDKMAEFYRERMGLDLNPDSLHCCTGRSDTVIPLCRECPMRKCCREKGLDFCMDCPEPCQTYLEYAETYVNRMGQGDVPEDL